MTQDVSRYFINHLNNLKKLANLVYICRHCLDLAFLEENFGRITRNYHKSKTFFFIDLITENKISFQNSFEECRRIVKLIREWLRECKGGVFFFYTVNITRLDVKFTITKYILIHQIITKM